MELAANPRTISSRLARVGLWLLRGWKFEGPVTAEPRAVMLAVPHTSNLDGLLLVLLTRSVGLKANWMVKDAWTKPPVGWLMKRVGAVPVNRDKANGMVGQMAAQFEERAEFHLMIPPEGTRSRSDNWRSGFYRIALAADVPVIPTYIDYRRRRGGIGEPITMTGDMAADMDRIREFYSEGQEMARFPEKFGPIALSGEETP